MVSVSSSMNGFAVMTGLVVFHCGEDLLPNSAAFNRPQATKKKAMSMLSM